MWLLITRITCAVGALYVLLLSVQILRVYWKVKFPPIMHLIAWVIVTQALSMGFVLGDVFEHLKDGVSWRLPLCIVILILGITSLQSLRDYFINAEIGDVVRRNTE